jgi:uncharacterized membrane protein
MGTEKPMEMAFIQSLFRQAPLSGIDPWFAGKPINYYYLGYFIVAMLAHVSEVDPWQAFNLGMASSFAMAAMGLSGFAMAILWRRGVGFSMLGGVLVASFTLMSGTLMGPLEALRSSHLTSPDTFAALGLYRLIPQYPGLSLFPQESVEHWWWWRSARTLMDQLPNAPQPSEVITEFPFFSLLLGDLHPHVLALPMWGMVLGVAASRAAGGSFWISSLRIPLLALLLGGCGSINLWDLPSMLLLALAA